MSGSTKAGVWLFGVILFAIFTFAFFQILLPKVEQYADKTSNTDTDKTGTKKQATDTKDKKGKTATTEKKEKPADTDQGVSSGDMKQSVAPDDQRYAVPTQPSPYDILKTDRNDRRIRQTASMFGEMKPEQAAKTLEAMDETIAMKVFSRIRPKQAASILDNMQPDQSAKFMEALIKDTKSDTKSTTSLPSETQSTQKGTGGQVGSSPKKSTAQKAGK